jgi:hypothetical protein
MKSIDHYEQFDKIKDYQRLLIFAPIISFLIIAMMMILELLPANIYNFSQNILFQIADWLYIGMLLLLVFTIAPVVFLLTQTALRKIHFAIRLDLIHRFLIYAWLVFFASRLFVSLYHAIYWFPEVVIRNVFLGVLLQAGFLILKRRYTEDPEAMFP